MRVLLDNCVDPRFAQLLPRHEVSHCLDLGWDKLSNGELLKAAEDHEFEVLLTVDSNMRFQQNLAGRSISLVTLIARRITLLHLEPLASGVELALSTLESGQSIVVSS